MRRRRVLAAVAAAAVAGAAGCSGESAEGTARTSGSATSTPTETVRATARATTTTATPLPDARAAAAVARRFVRRLRRGEYDRAHDRVAPDAGIGPYALEVTWLQAASTLGGVEGVGEATASAVEDGSEGNGRSDEGSRSDEGAPPDGSERSDGTRSDGGGGVGRRGGGGRVDDGGYEATVPVEGRYGRLDLSVALSGGRVRRLSVGDVRQRGSYSRPPYAGPAPVTRETTVGPDGRPSLPAAVTLPAGDRPVPGAVLVHGSGPQDRDSSIGPQRPFRDLALGLAARGVATLRYRKRTVDHDLAPARRTIDRVVVDDAVAAVGRLHAASRVESVAVVGHSLGGLAAPRIARRSGADGVAALAASGRHLWRTVVYQNRRVLAFDGDLGDRDRDALARLRAAFPQVVGGDLAPASRVQGLPGAWWNSLADYDQVAVARDLSVPTLVARPGRDAQVPTAGYDAWVDGRPGDRTGGRTTDRTGDRTTSRRTTGDRDGATTGDGSERSTAGGGETAGDEGDGTATETATGSIEVRRYPALNHLLLPGSGPSYVARYYTEPDNVDGQLVADLAAWLSPDDRRSGSAGE